MLANLRGFAIRRPLNQARREAAEMIAKLVKDYRIGSESVDTIGLKRVCIVGDEGLWQRYSPIAAAMATRSESGSSGMAPDWEATHAPQRLPASFSVSRPAPRSM